MKPMPTPTESNPDTRQGDGRLSQPVRLSVECLKSIAGARCCDIYDDLTEDEAKRQAASVYKAWKVGRDIRANHQPNARNSAAGHQTT